VEHSSPKGEVILHSSRQRVKDLTVRQERSLRPIS